MRKEITFAVSIVFTFVLMCTSFIFGGRLQEAKLSEIITIIPFEFIVIPILFQIELYTRTSRKEYYDKL